MQDFIHTNLGPMFQYFSTFLITFPNLKLLAIIYYASILLYSVIIFTDFCLLLFSYYFYYRFSLISHYSVAFNGILVKNSTFPFKRSIFFGSRYYFNDIPYTLRQCHCSRTSTFITASFIVFAAQINIFDCWSKTLIALAFFINKTEIDPDGAYFIRVNRIFNSILALYRVLLNTDIILAFDLNWPRLYKRKEFNIYITLIELKDFLIRFSGFYS